MPRTFELQNMPPAHTNLLQAATVVMAIALVTRAAVVRPGASYAARAERGNKPHMRLVGPAQMAASLRSRTFRATSSLARHVHAAAGAEEYLGAEGDFSDLRFTRFANWLVPGSVMLGRYPYVEPGRCQSTAVGDEQVSSCQEGRVRFGRVVSTDGHTSSLKWSYLL